MDNQERVGIPIDLASGGVQKEELGCVNVRFQGEADPNSGSSKCVPQTTVKSNAFKGCGDQ